MYKFLFLGLFIALSFLACKDKNQSTSAFFRSDASHSGVYNTKAIEEFHGVKWVFKTGAKVFSSPVIYQKVLFIGSDDSSFYAINSENGKKLWEFKTGGRVSSSSAVFDDQVYFMSFDAYLYCLNSKTGEEIWKFKTEGEKVFAAPGLHGMPEKDRFLDDPWDMFLSTPVVANNKVYFGCGAGTFYALDCKTGKQIWNFKTGGVVHSSPAYADSSVYFGSWDSYLYALNSENGELNWKFKTGIDTVNFNQVGFQSSPVIYKGTVYSGCRDAHIWAIDAKKGTLKWKFSNNGSWVINSPAIHNDTLYFTTSDTHKLIALNTVDGKEIFTGDCKSFGFSSVAYAGGKIYVGNFSGSLLAYDSNTGKNLWEFQTRAALLNKDSILNKDGNFNFQKVFKGNTYSENLKAMDVLYSVGSILSSPAVYNGMLYFGSADGNVYALY